jgi:hypothetical protein
VRGKSLIGERIQLAGMSVALNRSVELPGVEGLEPSAKPRQLARGELFYGFLDVFSGGHHENIASREEA